MSGRTGDLIPLLRIKLVDVGRLAARFGDAASAKALPRPADARPSSGARALRLLGGPAARIDKLPRRTSKRRLGTSALRLFRAFKILGDLKQHLPGAQPGLLVGAEVDERLRRARSLLHL